MRSKLLWYCLFFHIYFRNLLIKYRIVKGSQHLLQLVLTNPIITKSDGIIRWINKIESDTGVLIDFRLYEPHDKGLLVTISFYRLTTKLFTIHMPNLRKE